MCHICRMSLEDLEIHLPGDTPGNVQYLPVDGSQSILQTGNGIHRVRSLPSLAEISSALKEEDDADYSPEDDHHNPNLIEQEKALIRVSVEHNE